MLSLRKYYTATSNKHVEIHVKFVSLMIVISFVGLIFVSYRIYYTAPLIQENIKKVLKLKQLRSEVTYLDEVLTMSARLAAATGEARWENRYHQFEPALDKVLQELSAFSTKKEFIQAIDEANTQLVDMETQAFGLVKKRQSKAALELLLSEKYEIQKEIYQKNLEFSNDGLEQTVETQLSWIQKRVRINFFMQVFSILLGMFLWPIALASIRNWKSQIAELDSHLNTLKGVIDAHSIVAMTSTSGEIIYANDKFCEVSKYSRRELLGQNHRLINSGYHPKAFFVDMWKTIAGGMIWQGDICNRAKDGSHYWVASTLAPSLDVQNKPLQYIALRTDITKLKVAEAKIQEANRDLEQKINDQTDILITSAKMAALGEMAGSIAHEINTPIATISLLSGQLEDCLGDEIIDKAELSRMAKTIESMAFRIADIVKGLRSFARDGSRDKKEYVLIKKLLSETLILCSERFKNGNLRVIIGEFPDSLAIQGRQTQLSQVLLNLFNNAYDAVQTLTDKWIKIKVADTDQWVEIWVTDSGPGISSEVVSKMFQPFFTTKGVGKGTGLGLSISKKIIETHGGTLNVEMESPNTCFRITLPKR